MTKPNILIFMTDHQRGDTALPEHPAITPNLTRMAGEGVIFTNTFCPSPHCCPSRATFFSGLYPSRHGVWNNVCNAQALSTGLKPGVRLFSEDLAQAGYNLAYSGKWHVSVEESPKDRGWEEHHVSAVAGTKHEETWESIREAAARPDATERPEGRILRPGYNDDLLYGVRDAGAGHDECAVDEGVKAVERFAAEDKPWAVYVGCNMPHSPYCVPQKYLDMYDLADVALPTSFADTLEDKPNYYRKLRTMRFDQLSEREVREAIRHFWAMCTYLDDLFGRLLDAVEASGQGENTLVLFCSDHGDYAGEHGLFHKGIPAFRGAYHVPAVVRWPRGIENPGRRVDAFVSLADFAPTFTELAGEPVDEGLTGASLGPFLRDETPPAWRDAIHAQCNGVENYFTQRSVATKDFKYVYNGFDFDELYDLRNDPDEMRNLQDDPAYDDVKHDMVRRMWKFAYREQDTLGTAGSYITVGLAPHGPQEAFRD